MKTQKFEFRTANQIAKDKERRSIANRYVVLKSVVKATGFDVSDNRLFARIAEERGVSSVTVRNICVSAGVAQLKKKSKIC